MPKGKWDTVGTGIALKVSYWVAAFYRVWVARVEHCVLGGCQRKNRVFQLFGEIPESPGKNFRNERISYVRNFFVIPKKLVPSKNIENCRKSRVWCECTFAIFLF